MLTNYTGGVTRTTPPAKTAIVPDATVSTAAGLRAALARLHRTLRAHADTLVSPSQISALVRLEQSGPVRLGMLAQLEGIAAPTMSRVVDSLEASGLVRRIADPEDGRASVIALTTKGVRMISALRSSTTATLERALLTLSPEEHAVVDAVLPVLDRLASELQRD
jgi:DNA-binding MarR family transcriptional regulator